MKKAKWYILLAALLLVVGGIYYYVTLPAINIHSAGLWTFLLTLCLFAMAVIALLSLKSGKKIEKAITKSVPLKIAAGVTAVLAVIYFLGSLLSSPIINAGKYQKLLTVQEREFTEDIKEVNYNQIPLLDKESATLLGNRKMGSMVDMVSQFEVSNLYTQINYNDEPVRITPLTYASPIKWLTNQSSGIPAYIKIDMATQETECVKLEQPIKYSEAEYFNRNIYRHLRFRYPTYIFDNLSFEIDEEGVPYWVCPVKKFNIGLFGGQTIGSVVLCNAQTGETQEYAIEDVPQWIDRVYSADLLVELYDYHGTLKHGYFNSILGQKDCLQTTSGYNYIALEDDVWVYTGITSLNSDQSIVGFVLMNQRTMETRFYSVEGAIEYSAMDSAEGQVQNLGYQASFPLLLNIANEPTYFMVLKDDAGLVKKYAMVNIQRYQWVAIGDTVADCEKAYISLLNTNGISSAQMGNALEVSGTITTIAPIVIDGNTHYYVCISGNEEIFDFNMTDAAVLDILKYKEGDTIKISYAKGGSVNEVLEIK
ncbi:MAG: CvpA family protein [Lachnospiraceae bacterium]|nr:CvpA family protein [Lachnospiraceae bacterium]